MFTKVTITLKGIDTPFILQVHGVVEVVDGIGISVGNEDIDIPNVESVEVQEVGNNPAYWQDEIESGLS